MCNLAEFLAMVSVYLADAESTFLGYGVCILS